MTLAHWDEVEGTRRDVGEMRATFRRIGAAAGASAVGVARIDVAVHQIGVGDTIVYLASGPEHTVIAGDDGLSVLAYGENHAPIMTRLPRAGVGRRGGLVIELSDEDPLQR